MRLPKMSRCVSIGRAIAAANVAAVQAHSQVDPARADLQAIFAARGRSMECPWSFTSYVLACVRKVDGGVFHARLLRFCRSLFLVHIRNRGH